MKKIIPISIALIILILLFVYLHSALQPSRDIRKEITEYALQKNVEQINVFYNINNRYPDSNEVKISLNALFYSSEFGKFRLESDPTVNFWDYKKHKWFRLIIDETKTIQKIYLPEKNKQDTAKDTENKK